MTVMKFVRATMGMSQSDLAKAIGVTQPKISMWENKRASMPARRVEEIARVLGIAPERLLLDIPFTF